MNNFKKIGLTALAGSLVATSVYAGEMSVAGAASLRMRTTLVLTVVKQWLWVTN